MSETAYVSDFFQLIDMKVLITEDSLDSLLSIKISSDGGKSYTDYSVSSLKNGTTFDCSPNDLKVICDANVLKYIQVLADGEKATSSVDLSNYLKYRDIYIDVYKNPYYGVKLTNEELNNLSGFDRTLTYYTDYKYYLTSESINLIYLKEEDLIPSKDDSKCYSFYHFFDIDGGGDGEIFFKENDFSEDFDDFYYVGAEKSCPYAERELFITNVRVHFIKHF